MYGITIKRIREDKNLPIKAVYWDICSKTNAIAFEKGERMLAADKFNQVLKNLAITMEEFLWIAGGYQPSKQRSFSHAIKRSWNAADYDQFEQKLREIDAAKDNPIDRLQLASYHLLRDYGKGQKLNPQEVELISNYFKELSLWTMADLTFFANNCYVLPYRLMVNLLLEAAKAQEHYELFPEIEVVFATVLINCLERVFDEGDYESAETLTSLLGKYTIGTSLAGYRLFEKYYQARLLLAKGDAEQAKAEL